MVKRSIVLAVAVALSTTSPVGSRPSSKRLCFGRKATIVGSSKDDTIQGTRHRDIIVGLGGDDVIVAFDGDDLVCAGKGSDLVDGGYGADRESGGPGQMDVVAFKIASTRVRADLGSGKSSGGAGRDRFNQFEGILGSPYADRLDGDERSNFLIGGGDVDSIHAGAENDLLWGMSSYDQLDGGAGGADVASYYDALSTTEISVSPESGYGATPDRLTNIEGLEGPKRGYIYMYGDSRANGFFSGGGTIYVSGGGGDDYIEASLKARQDHVDGGAGDDIVFAGGGDDNVNTGWAFGGDDDRAADGNDILFGEAGSDDVFGGSGNDVMRGDAGDDYVEGGPGDDTVFEGEGSDNVFGSDGNDVVSYEKASKAVAIVLDEGTATGNGSDAVDGSFETIVGSPFADTMSGNDLANVIFGLQGDDEISGLDGDDTLDGGEGSDTADGGFGLDECVNFELALFCRRSHLRR
ncbi:MAG TPA: calcium-binding protein [Actinomycetota bacterium]|jgi:Ca2+-binding RTX toxin-like protein